MLYTPLMGYCENYDSTFSGPPLPATAKAELHDNGQSWFKVKAGQQEGPAKTTMTTMMIVRRSKNTTRRQDHKETPTTRAMSMVTTTCHCVWQWSLLYGRGKRPSLTTTEDMTGQGEGTTTTIMTRKTAMTTIMQDWLQERCRWRKRTMTSLKESFNHWLTSGATFHMVAELDRLRRQ